MRGSSSRSRRTRDDSGYVATLVALLVPVVFIGLAALSVDTARWYVEMQRAQNAADAAALAGVTYLPQDLPNATSLAKAISSRNGFTDGANGVTVSVTTGKRPSQLKVTVTSTVNNVFGKLIGTPTTKLTRTAVADYTGPAPMGSPCNTFGNEPSAGDGSSSPSPTGSVLPLSGFSNCQSEPKFWAVVEEPETGKVQGDRYQTRGCEATGVHECSGSTNDEYTDRGYFFVVKILPDAVSKPVTLQLYDAAFVNAGQICTSSSLPTTSDIGSNFNAYATSKSDARARYASNSGSRATYCAGDSFPGSGYSGTNSMTTSFVLREQTDTQDPMRGSPISGCIKQHGA